EPTVDLLHVVGYLFGAARAAGRESEGWPWYVRWLRSCWQGQVAAVIAGMAEGQERVGRPPPGEVGANGPGGGLGEALTVFAEQRVADGLPALSSVGLADDQQPGGIVSGGVQRAGQGPVEVLEPSGGCGGDPASPCGGVERRRPLGPILRRTAGQPLPPTR